MPVSRSQHDTVGNYEIEVANRRHPVDRVTDIEPAVPRSHRVFLLVFGVDGCLAEVVLNAGHRKRDDAKRSAVHVSRIAQLRKILVQYVSVGSAQWIAGSVRWIDLRDRNGVFTNKAYRFIDVTVGTPAELVRDLWARKDTV